MLEENVFLDKVITLTNRQLLVVESLMCMALLGSGVCTDAEKLTDEITRMNHMIYHPETIPEEFLDYTEVSKEDN
jgi:hypothetical protein